MRSWRYATSSFPLMADGDPARTNALYLDHIAAGIQALEDSRLDSQDRIVATRLAWRLAALSTIREH